jgi:hypothetical protein
MKTLIILLVITFGFTINIFSQIEFTTHIITSQADGATYVLAFDVENDGDMDIISTAGNDDKISWYENDGDQPTHFSENIITTNADGVAWLYATDMEGDGDTDVFSASLFDDKVAWYENDGNGLFTTHVIDAGQNPNGAFLRFSVYVYDVDSDGDMDVLSGSWDKTEILWHENDGSNLRFTTHLIDNPGQHSHVIATDLDDDGDADVISASQVSNTVAWYENDGNENFTTHVITNTAGGARTVKATDLDEDGDIDVLAGCWDKKVEWYENDGSQNYITHTIANSRYGSGSIYVVDVDNDGDLDILTTTGDENMVGWLENDGDENFSFHSITTGANFADTVWGSDLDGDGDIDVLSAALHGDQIAWYENGLITTDTTDVERRASPIPEEFALHQNYPNPFNPTTNIEFSTPQNGFVTLKVYNLLGQEVATLLETYKSAGRYAVNFDASALASGLYYYTLTAGELKETRKMVLLH